MSTRNTALWLHKNQFTIDRISQAVDNSTLLSKCRPMQAAPYPKISHLRHLRFNFSPAFAVFFYTNLVSRRSCTIYSSIPAIPRCQCLDLLLRVVIMTGLRPAW